MLITLAATLGVIAAILGSISLIYTKGIRPIIDGFARLHAVFEKVMEYDERLKIIETNSKQLTNNGGTHMKDAVDRIERAQQAQAIQSAINEAANKSEFLSIYKQLTRADENQAKNAAAAAAADRIAVESAAAHIDLPDPVKVEIVSTNEGTES